MQFEGVDVRGHPVEKRAGQPLGSEGLHSFIEGPVAGDQPSTAFIALRDHVEQQFGARPGERYKAQFVDDEQSGWVIFFCRRIIWRSSRASIWQRLLCAMRKQPLPMPVCAHRSTGYANLGRTVVCRCPKRFGDRLCTPALPVLAAKTRF